MFSFRCSEGWRSRRVPPRIERRGILGIRSEAKVDRPESSFPCFHPLGPIHLEAIVCSRGQRLWVSGSHRLAVESGHDARSAETPPWFLIEGAHENELRQTHSVRGFISGQLKKKLGLKVRSVKREGKHVCSIKPQLNDPIRSREADRLLLFCGRCKCLLHFSQQQPRQQSHHAVPAMYSSRTARKRPACGTSMGAAARMWRLDDPGRPPVLNHR
jgi:hypothetical protein